MNMTDQLNPAQIAILVQDVFASETIVCFDGGVLTKLSRGDARCTITLQLTDQTKQTPPHLGLHIQLTICGADDRVADFSQCGEKELKKCLSLLQEDLFFATLKCYESEDTLLVELSRVVTIPFNFATLQNQLEVISTDLLAVVSEWHHICTPLQLILLGDISTKDEIDEHLKSTHPNLIN